MPAHAASIVASSARAVSTAPSATPADTIKAEGTVISGTHRAPALLPAFLSVLKAHAQGNDITDLLCRLAGVTSGARISDRIAALRQHQHGRVLLGWAYYGESLWPDSMALWDSRLMQDMIETVMDELNARAAPGFYFGAHPDDGADFGFWRIEED
ncbi:TPA: hypothetical protein ACHQHX_006055 [Pseudomonas aeruginosa]